ncbi:MAG: hypothetical protein AAGI44_11930 [Pseudomonadota bacterium]
MKPLTTLPIAVLLLLPLGYAQAQCEPYHPCSGYVATDVETEGETETSELGLDAVDADEDIGLEGVETDEDAPEIGINGFGERR